FSKTAKSETLKAWISQIPTDDEPGVEIHRLYRTRGKNKRAVDRTIQNLKQLGVDVPTDTAAAFYRLALFYDWGTMRQKCRDLYRQFGKEPPPQLQKHGSYFERRLKYGSISDSPRTLRNPLTM